MASAEFQVWSAPECAATVAYEPRVLDGIRLAVLEAFYAFPRGGAEIGGVLYGAYADGRVCVTAWRNMACEHAGGPSFTLSDNDHARLAALLSAPGTDPELSGLAPVGWYHSHTRSEIFLSAQDVEVHERYFPQTWQVALVLRPSISGTRAGFFVRDADGRLRTDASYRVFPLAPLSGRALARASESAEPPEAPGEGRDPAAMEGGATSAGAQDVAVPPEAAGEPEGEPEALPPVEPPDFLRQPPPRPKRLWRWVLLVPVVVSGLAVYATRDYWLGMLPAVPESVPAAASQGGQVDLQAAGEGGRLNIRWNSRAPAVAQARGGTLTLRDGEFRTTMAIEPGRLLTGGVSYLRQTGRVEVQLELAQPGGRRIAVQTTFVDDRPAPPPLAESAGELRRQRDMLQSELHEARTGIIKQRSLIRKLQRAVRAAQPTPQPPPARPPGQASP